MDAFSDFIVIFASGLRLSVPLILACLAGLWSERSGVVDIGLEGKILAGAFAAAAVAFATGSAWIGLAGGVAAWLTDHGLRPGELDMLRAKLRRQPAGPGSGSRSSASRNRSISSTAAGSAAAPCSSPSSAT